MSTPGMNPHKKGEHVFNDIAGSIENAFRAALRADRLSSLALTGRNGLLRLEELPRTLAGIAQIERDPVLTEARKIAAPATGLHNDANSVSYGDARAALEVALSEIVLRKAHLLWIPTHQANSSFLEFEKIVGQVRESKAAVEAARIAFVKLIDSAIDPAAEKAVLAARISDFELKKRAGTINAMKLHCPQLKHQSLSLLAAFVEEIETVLANRIRD